MNEDRLRRLYTARLPINKRALDRVRSCLAGVIEDFSRDRLFRVSLVNHRIKPFKSLLRKALRNGIEDEEEVFKRISDIVGVRLVTNNLGDIERLVEAIKSLKSLEYDEESLQDFVNSPKASGYRAIHFAVHCTVEYKGKQYRVPCEVQIQTLLQNSWAVLTHQDVYKQESELPKHAVLLSRRLADQLGVLDNIAQDIRDAVSEAVRYVQVSDDEPITKEGLASLYLNLFDISLHDYQAQVWMNALAEEGAQTIAEAKALLPDDEVIEKMASIYEDVWGDAYIPEDTKLYYGAKIIGGASNAYQNFRRAMERERGNLETFARREVLAVLPETMDKLIEVLRSGSMIIPRLWDALELIGGLSECGRCGERYFDSDRVYEALCSHYEVENTELLDMLYEIEGDGGFEVESAELPGYCSYCGHMMTKD